MASPPPPYANVTGISRAVMKDSPQETFANYDGNARPGELVVNLDVSPPTLYIGNSLGNLNQVTGNGGGNASLPLANGNSQFDIATANGNVTITANGAETWTFGSDGLLTFPGTPRIDTDANNFEVQAAENINFEANAVVNIYTDGGNNAYQWQFGDDAILILADGNSTIQSIANSSLDPTNPNVSTMVLTPDPNFLSQVLVLDPTGPSHIHLRAYASSNVDEPSANIYLGGENTAFEVTAGANNKAVVHSGTNTWTFENNGQLTFPGNQGFMYGPGSNDLRIVNNQNGGFLQLGWQDGAVLSPNANLASNVTLNSSGVVITTTDDTFVTTNDWTFGSTGILTVPGNVISPNTFNVGTANSYTHYDQTTGGTELVSAGNLYLYANTAQWLFLSNGTMQSQGAFTLESGGNISLAIAGNANSNVAFANTGMTLSGNVSLGKLITSNVTNYSGLPAATTPGIRAFISDANLVAVGNFGNAVSGGGSNTVPVWSDGNNWLIG